jgi:hypothetical protein
MPIRPELKQFYGVEWKTVTRPRILARAKNCCEWCGVPDGAEVIGRNGQRSKIVLTVMHLNHVSGDDRDDNLKAACQACHLEYDQEHHHETRATRKDESRPLISGLKPPKGSISLGASV